MWSQTLDSAVYLTALKDKPYRPQIHLAPTLILKTMVSQQIFEYDEKQMQKGIKCLYKMYTIYTVS